MYERDVAELLGIPETVTQAALLPVAHEPLTPPAPAPAFDGGARGRRACPA